MIKHIDKYRFAYVLCIFLFILNIVFLIFNIFRFNFDLDFYSNLLKHPFVLLVTTFALTSVVGQFISNQYQKKTKEKDIMFSQVNANYLHAKEVYSDLSSLMDRRIYLSKKVTWALKDRKRGVGDKVDNMFKIFNDFLYEWNNALNRGISMLELYYGKEAKDLFEKRICADFNWIGMIIRCHVLDLPEHKRPLPELEYSINLTSARVYKLNKLLLDKMKRRDF